ncbi:MAG: acetate kinase, partial [Ruminococcaceae bacterium]|nr:acetate kinase [Oscillospiraceae bacterium]
MNVLVINAGSSSLKYQLINTETEVSYAKGLCDRIGNTGSSITHKNLIKNNQTKKEADMPDHAIAMKYVIEALTDPEYGCISSMDEIDAIGHRVVHGGPYFSSSILLTEEVFETLKSCRAFAPLHTEAHIMGINGCLSVMADKPQVLVFDTAFHQTMA